MTSDIFSLAGKTALVTGASSAGFGRHFAGVLARAGANVVLAARRKDRLDAAVAELTGAGGRAAAVTMDVTDARSIAAGFDAAEAALGPVSILVDNAGVVTRKGSLETTPADWDQVMDVNLKGAFFVATEAARRMIAAHSGGAIVTIASIAGIRPAGGVATYAGSKAGIEHLTRTMAQEWARFGIRVNALAPGYFVTDLNRDFLDSEAGEAVKKRIPMRRFGAYGDLDGALLLLAADAGRFMTGATVVVDGGHLIAGL
ncbi:MAG: glucose 1-dehydrogenase [Pseudomonadota bacterium]